MSLRRSPLSRHLHREVFRATPEWLKVAPAAWKARMALRNGSQWKPTHKT
jgi:hypothetical protein